MSEVPILSRPVHVSDIGEDGLVVTIEATPAERDALAADYDLRAVRELNAEVRLLMAGKAGVRAEGHLHANIVQTCVVSLVPVDQAIDEDFSIRFSPANETAPTAKSGAEIHLDPADLDPPEPLTGPTIDLGPIVTEQFVLAIDPYPRAPGAELPPEAADPASEAATSPFAALAGLRRRPGGSR
jgi:uncharacterized metal-binding protein YceD (DUF177 family)